MENSELRRLFGKYMEGQLTPAEYEQLSEAAQTHTVNDWQEVLAPLIENTTTTETFDEQEWKGVIEYILRQPAINPAKTIPMNRWFRRIVVAASIILAIGLGTYFLFFNKPSRQDDIVINNLPKDVEAPKGTKAMITLANGQQVYLDSVGIGTLAMQGNVKLVKLANGQIAYQTASGETINEIKYNTLTNPRGSKVIDMTLADGSQVWLNAGSSVTFPVAFAGNERKVAITGEAYFEVAHNTAMPFNVSKGEMEVTVLGTHFNVNAYDDEADIKVTLLEGSVKILRSVQNDKGVIIKPGEQAQIATSGDFRVVSGIDIEEVMAWKGGKFLFNKTDVQTTMRQIARWYDIEIVYQGNIKGFFNGTISRKENVSEVLKMLEMTDEVHFTIEGRKIVVKP